MQNDILIGCIILFIMDMSEIEFNSMEGKKPTEEEMQFVFSNVDECPLEVTTIISEVGEQNPEYLVNFAEEIGEMDSVDDHFHFEQFLWGIEGMIEVDPSVYFYVEGHIRNGVENGRDNVLHPAFNSVIKAVSSDVEVSSEILVQSFERIINSRGTPMVVGMRMFDEVVKANHFNSIEAFALFVSMLSVERVDVVRHCGNLLIGLVLDDEVPNGVGDDELKEVVEGVCEYVTVPEKDVQDALNKLDE